VIDPEGSFVRVRAMNGLPIRRIAGRVLRIVSGALAGLVLSVAAASAQMAFYQATPQEIDGPPGTIIRQEPMAFAPAYITAVRVLYRSRGLHGEPIAVSGVVIAPRGAAPPGGRPIVAWTHPTSGVATRCAPSLAMFVFEQIQGLRDMADRGYVVAATDYPGLGGPGVHPYLIGESEARATLDIVRAARSMTATAASSDFAVWGHSQGGQAALYVGLIARGYAPELHLVGVAAAAPATELARLMRDDLGSPGGDNLTAMTLWSWQRVFDAPMSRVVEPRATPIVDRLALACIESIYDVLVRRRISARLRDGFLSVKNPLALEPWRSLAAANTPGILPRDVPLFIAQGSNDQLVRPEVTRDYVARACRAGGKVRFLVMPGVGHGLAAHHSARAAVDWIAGRFAGDAPPDDC
jgi:pimeloyl-ACP methyl ester carboxylesterase